VLMRKPLGTGSVADNVLAYGTGAINIDATRIDSGTRDAIATHIPEGQGSAHGLALQKHQAVVGETTLGRWPADAIFSHSYGCDQTGCVEGCAVGILDAQDPDRRTPASRYFYCPKASRAEKDLGMAAKANTHKAVKPVEICEWLIRLICPPGGVLLDPFCGTGSTGVAAVRLAGGSSTSRGSTSPQGSSTSPGLFVGIEHDDTWLNMAHQRMTAPLPV
jgi:site-specific DNA-methyltransferase (adenine-specific)